MNSNNWDADTHEIEAGGKIFFVSAVFDWERDSIDYQFDPLQGYSGAGRDRIALVACAVLKIEIWGENDGDAVEIALVKQISETLLAEFRDSGKGVQDARWGRWL